MTKILKVCNQSAVAAAYLRLKGIVSPKFPFKDRGGWKILIFFLDEKITVRHVKKEQGLNGQAQTNFEWQYDMHFDSDMKDLKAVALSIVDVRFENPEVGVKQLELEKFLRGFNLPIKQ